ncbi:DUF547 domain-containing protein [Qipengyuania marisflavi]|uniref:DUF547 domain-containing protein n=1 Tax=Qipengyuania marisflavi TaxID=2486356 RepID=A0A5S3P206_9SPHN|nr:DUF547 domain-containing protein [Qipengyuania marisflavi]TMM46679.1 DUF547 domain-containing protein [Qipengyuania marisflavi]
MKTFALTLAGLSVAMLQPDMVQAQSAPAPDVLQASPDASFARFTPRDMTSNTRIDYDFWDNQLRYMVLWMGPSTRQGASKPYASTGTRRVYGHDSRYRLEGNRIIFSFLEDGFKASLAEYRADLEQTANVVDIATLPRNEQLAFWINLHNAAVTDAIAQIYPVTSPDRAKLNGDKRPLDETPFITVNGVQMSPRDIRTKIVYPNWDDPRVIYGFFRGDIGGPSIQRQAYTGQNVSGLLAESAREFVNSLRGVESYGGSLLVSKIYEEAAGFYFPDGDASLRKHLLKFADEPVAELIASKDSTKYNDYASDIADLAGGEREPSYNYVEMDENSGGLPISQSIRRMLFERAQKYDKLRRDERIGQVTVILGELPDGDGQVNEVD